MIRSFVYLTSRFGLSGYLRHARATLTGKPTLIATNPPGVAHPIFLQCRSTDITTFDKVFTKKEYDFDVVEPPSVIIDAGANVGLASVYFANRFPHARILSVEPEADNFGLLRKNVQPYPNVIPIHAALWHENTEIDLVDPGFGQWGFVTEDRRESPAADARHRVKAVTVDRLMQEAGVDRVSILKMDIEGAEREVFSSSTSWLPRVDAIIVELHDRRKPGCSRSFDNGSNGFAQEWLQGENVFLSRGLCVVPRWR